MSCGPGWILLTLSCGGLTPSTASCGPAGFADAASASFCCGGLDPGEGAADRLYGVEDCGVCCGAWSREGGRGVDGSRVGVNAPVSAGRVRPKRLL